MEGLSDFLQRAYSRNLQIHGVMFFMFEKGIEFGYVKKAKSY